MKDHWVKVCDIAEIVGTSTEWVHNILHKKIAHEKDLCAMGAVFIDCQPKTYMKEGFSNVCQCLTAIHGTFCIDSWL